MLKFKVCCKHVLLIFSRFSFKAVGCCVNLYTYIYILINMFWPLSIHPDLVHLCLVQSLQSVININSRIGSSVVLFYLSGVLL